MVLGGVNIPFAMGPKGHSDGDVLLHAVCDAMLGALGMGDIGMRFPDTDPKYKDISSKELLEDVCVLMSGTGMQVHDLDCVVILEEPKIGPYREEITRTLSNILDVPESDINVKGKTSEGLGAIGHRDPVRFLQGGG